MKASRILLNLTILLALMGSLFAVTSPAHAAGNLITVTTTALTSVTDSLCSLTEALQAAQLNTSVDTCAAGSDAGIDTIKFDIDAVSDPGYSGGIYTFSVTATITVSSGVVIDGTSQPGYAGSPVLKLNGNRTADPLLKFMDGSDGSTVEGLMLTNAYVTAIWINTGADSITVKANYINTDGLSQIPAMATARGVQIQGANNVIVGGSSAADRNLIAGDIGVLNGGGSNNLIQGNYFGLKADGITPLTGLVKVDAAISIAGAAPTTNNVIRDNVMTGFGGGVTLSEGTSHTTIAGNMVGVAADGLTKLGMSYGIWVNGSSANTIGGPTAADRNIVAGNQRQIWIQNGSSHSADSNAIIGNYIGTDATGETAMDPTAAAYGISIRGGDGNRIGGPGTGEGNLISGFGSYPALQIIGDPTPVTNTVILGNRIGTDKDGVTTIANNQGISIQGAAVNLGDGTMPGNNLIAGSKGTAVALTGSGTVGTTIFGNRLGVNVSGTGSMANNIGISLDDGASAQITGNWIGNSTSMSISMTSPSTVAADSINNCFSNNGILGVWSNTPASLPYNWWNAASGPTATDNPGGTGDAIYTPTTVTYIPFLTSAPGACAPVLSPSITALDFGTHTIGSNTTLTATLTNTGSLVMNFTSLTTAPPYNIDGGSNTCPTAAGTLAPGASCTLAIQFSPTSDGAAPGTVTITTDAGSSPDIIDLTGTGPMPVVNLSPTALDFGTQAVGSSTTLAATLTNTGDAVMHFTSIVTAPPYSIDGTTTCPTATGTLELDASCTVVIQFSPSAVGPASGSVAITTDAGSSPDALALSGTSVALELLTNRDFEIDADSNRKPDSWVLRNFNALTDRRDCKVRQSGSCSLRLRGNGMQKLAMQTFYRSGAAGDVLRFNLWSKSSSVPSGSVYRLQVRLYNGATLVTAKTLKFPLGTHPFRQVNGSITAPGPYTKIVYKIILTAPGGTVWFDLGSLTWTP